MKKIIYKIILTSLIIVLILPGMVKASTADDKLQEINELQQQIDANKSLLDKKSNEVDSLENQVAVFDGRIRDSELQISKTQAEIENLQDQIRRKEEELRIQKENLFETMRVMYESGGDQGMIEIIASSNTLSDVINKSQYLESVKTKINETVDSITKLKADLETNKKESEDLLVQQESYKQSLSGQRAAKDQLLSQTRGEESEYKKRLEEARKAQAKVWAEYEAALAQSRASNSSSYIGGSGNGYLISPSNGYLTQGYGCTWFAQCGNPNGPYGGKIHNGLDISMGYPGPIKAAADGVILDIGQEYNSHGWGNWIIIRHPNGLATLYAHLSRFMVSVGQTVSKGDVIGLEGNTGASTGSHLHFSVYTNLIIYNGPYHGPGYDGTVNPYSFL
ncbi:hypothetical protein A2V71_03225 [Candidatus Berkelbacteria bacterium RBG_13_40_8]|uniref:M23ase beta-sheet core domain-containing protein n=1 Tax=Candidatus Berkelbacteria bacterium RBG_13_40_8 TaxID=1797467 RepID=A0A1F5DPI6_9BACT|nr:MAG: hypothetical protein A2V71_03225 [Candidatus Berkelbacteria bacterium RBG_13_40_8]